LLLNIGSFENKAMAEYLTKYPKTISFFDGLKGVVNIEKSSNVEQLHVVVKKSVSELFQMFYKRVFQRSNLNISNRFKLVMVFP